MAPASKGALLNIHYYYYSLMFSQEIVVNKSGLGAFSLWEK